MDEVIAGAARARGAVGTRDGALKRPENMTAYKYYLRGPEHRLVGVSDDHRRGRMWEQQVSST
jgi:adenylate cyclase